ncbi:FAD/FMN-containing dehydrogenase [Kitasatospora sp. SolWspMP-SS2h]|uniref:FAD-binding oxidoreductase n=1 Tax=Kitasatospora sp. SolWspMP-SS2h TaxID=1305729 RepID=UPI000DBA8B72|nr:FAD-dependent oxidoreductase [Kitasatospora sp. SolWspMP-SS2h]RAJ40406.1 FAD/FMN-containing dehydrogenase [Kitasatospora sp. SolWspMP-SS2h]
MTADWALLDKHTAGPLLRPGDGAFHESSAAFNERWADRTPTAVLRAAGPPDVLRAINWARDHAVPIVPRGGGHSYAGNSVNSGLVVDLRALDAITVDPATGRVTVGGGVLTGALYAALRPHGLALPLGNGAGVGIAGLALGGGSAATSRRFGLTADTLRATTLATADGTVLTCDADRNEDLYWACRGGGGGNFGINLDLTFQAVEAPAASTCLLLWEAEHAEHVLPAVQELMLTAPEETSLRLGVATSGGRTLVSTVGLHLGPAAELRALLAPAFAAGPPLRAEIADRAFWDAMDHLRHETSGGAFAVRTHFAARPLPPAALAAALAHLAAAPPGGNADGCGFALFGWGGAINRVDPAATAFVHRDAQYLVSLDTSWLPGEDPAPHLDWLAGLDHLIAAHATGGAYLNFTDPDLRGWRDAYHGANYPRLVATKQRHDPDRLFAFPQSIGS